MADRPPAFVRSLLEQRLHGHGLGISDLAAMSNLVHKEAFTEMRKVYSALRLPTVGAVTRPWSGLQPLEEMRPTKLSSKGT